MPFLRKLGHEKPCSSAKLFYKVIKFSMGNGRKCFKQLKSNGEKMNSCIFWAFELK